MAAESVPTNNMADADTDPESISPALGKMIQDLNKTVIDQIDGLKQVIREQNKELRSSVDEVAKSVSYSQQEIEDLKAENKHQKDSIQELRDGLKQANRKIDNLSSYVKRVDSNQLRHETYMRKYNIIFNGVEENDQEDVRAVVMKIITDNLQITHLNMADFDKIHRYGRSIQGKPRPILAKSFSLTIRDTIFRNVKKLSNTNMFISEDVPEEIRVQRAELWSVVANAKYQGRSASLKGDTANIDGRNYKYQDLDSLPPGLTLCDAKTVSTVDSVYFQGKHNPLSNFYAAPITDADGHIYNSAEQLFQVKKTQYLGRDDIAKKLSMEFDPFNIKKIGDSVKVPPRSNWEENKLDIMRDILKLKFTQSPDLGRTLSATGNKQLVEATRDMYWGCGAHLHSSEVQRGTWKGNNHMGKLLTVVREELGHS